MFIFYHIILSNKADKHNIMKLHIVSLVPIFIFLTVHPKK